MCALKYKNLKQKSAQLNPFQNLSEKEKHLISLDYGNFWFKMMVRRNLPVMAVLSIV